MEQQITWLILTVVLNALFTGIVVSYFNKRLEAKFAKQIFEDQLKFKEIYTKRAKAMEDLYQKFVIFKDALVNLSVNAITYFRIDGEKINKRFKIMPWTFKEDYSDMNTKLADLRHFYEANKLFLSDRANEGILEMFFKSLLAGFDLINDH